MLYVKAVDTVNDDRRGVSLAGEIEYLTAKQAAALLGVTPAWLCLCRRKIRSDGPRWHRRGKKPLYSRADIEAFIQDNLKGT